MMSLAHRQRQASAHGDAQRDREDAVDMEIIVTSTGVSDDLAMEIAVKMIRDFAAKLGYSG